VRLVFAGTPAAAAPSLQAALDSSHEVIAVLTRPDARAGRGRREAVSPVKLLAQQAGVPVLQPARVGAPEVLDELKALAPDCCPVVAYGALVPPAALVLPPLGWVNLHFSLLPAWRGAAPVQHTVIAGDQVTGASVFRLEEGLDTGPVLGTLTEAVRPRETAGELLDRLAVAGASLLVAVLDALAARAVTPVPQPHDGVSLAPKLTVDDARVRWTDPALAVDRRIRGCTPAPGAWTTSRGVRVKLGPVTLSPEVTDLAPGDLAVTRGGVLVGTGSHAVALGDVQPAGKRAVPAADWARGLRPTPGERLGASADDMAATP